VEWKGHKIGVYWLPAFAGAVLLLVFGLLSPKELWQGLTASGEMNPLKILALFLSLTFLSVYLDELGFFRRLAFSMLRHARGSQKKLFLCLYLLVSILTVFTSNDVVVLTFTPFICHFCKEEKISPIPYLVGEFVAANTWSMALVIGNPTNIYLSAVCGIGFAEYLSVMWLPTFLSGLVALGVLLLLFKKQLSTPLLPLEKTAEKADKNMIILGVAHLAGCIVCLAVSSYISVSMWLVSVSFAGSLAVCTLVYALTKKRVPTSGRLLGSSFRREPWELVPFVLSMFTLVLALQKYGVTGEIAALLSGGGDTAELVKYGLTSFLSANLINNIPMSVLFGGVIESGVATNAKIYATIVGSNLGAYLTPVGALAGIMWTGLLRTHEVEFSFKQFILYGGLVAIPALLAALLGLWIVF
jgi:arsenical pump membrane protein